jgi:hypothetical protein
MDFDFAKELDKISEECSLERRRMVIQDVLKQIETGKMFISVPRDLEDQFVDVSSRNRHLTPPFNGVEPFCGVELARREAIIQKSKDCARKLYAGVSDTVESKLCQHSFSCECGVFAEDLKMINTLCPSKFKVRTATLYENPSKIVFTKVYPGHP